MRLYCPTCRETFEEAQDRYDRMGGQVPCRVCRTTLENPDAGGGGGSGQEMLSQVFTVGDDGKTTMLTMEDFGLSAGKTTILETPSEDALRNMGLLPGGPGGHGGGAPHGPPPPGPAPSPNRASGPVAPPNFGPPPGHASGPVAPPNFGPPPGHASGPIAPPSFGPPPGAGGPGPAPAHSPYGSSSPSGPVMPPNFGPPPVASPTGPVPQYQPPQQPGSGQPPQFHSNPTYIFPQQEAAAGPPPGAPPGFQGRMPQQGGGGGAGGAGGGGYKTMPQAAATTGPDGRPKHKKKVVIGGAAADQKTQMFNAADFAMIASQNSSQEIKPPPGFDAPPPGPAPMTPVGPGAGHQPVVVEVPQAPVGPPPGVHATQIEPRESRGGGLKLVLIVLVVLALVGAGVVLVLDYVRSGDGPSTGGTTTTETGGGESAGPQVSATRLLQNLRAADYVRPPFVSGGTAPADQALVLGALPNSTGDTYYWLATPQAPTPTEVTGGLASALPASDLPLYLVFDGSTPASLVIETLGAARTAGLAPWLVAGSPMGTDIHYVFDASAAAATTRVRLGSTTIAISSAGWAEPRVFCYGSTLPLRDVREVLDGVFGTAGVNDSPIAVGVDLADGVELQKLFNLLEGIERAGLQVQIGVSGSAPPTCPP